MNPNEELKRLRKMRDEILQGKVSASIEVMEMARAAAPEPKDQLKELIADVSANCPDYSVTGKDRLLGRLEAALRQHSQTREAYQRLREAAPALRYVLMNCSITHEYADMIRSLLDAEILYPSLIAVAKGRVEIKGENDGQ